MTSAPLILTLALDEPATRFFNDLRQQHFPPERNFLAAHLTLFHHLPGTEQVQIEETLTTLAQNQAPLALTVPGLQFLGQGVAYQVSSQELERLHRDLQRQWWAWLTPQDQQKRRPHVTIQNKVRPEVARALHEQLAAGFEPFAATGVGLQLWAYRNGPWEWLRSFAFGG
ncbi:2'-5' RNA ligase family protein [Hymenobacter metallicola]|uniref:2'-5' RNA ligase family protein n=1 Tax=Hymenobacter metallicola TaxID=2563114 RepID=A0A4Z0QGN7_9BACT|nr:2'-5' RNA ligase family protein [Hymenobacter metallicola]TGE29207.1 2'-5' RNA ligase family protein [Hymenobacter metallicola]